MILSLSREAPQGLLEELSFCLVLLALDFWCKPHGLPFKARILKKTISWRNTKGCTKKGFKVFWITSSSVCIKMKEKTMPI